MTATKMYFWPVLIIVFCIAIIRQAEVGPLVLIGQDSEVGQSSVVINSCLGTNCKIGANVKVVNSFVGSNVVIEDECELHQVVVVDGSILGRGTELKPWVLVDGKKQFRIQLPQEPQEGDDSSSENSDVIPVGIGKELSDAEEDNIVGIQDEDFKSTHYSALLFIIILLNVTSSVRVLVSFGANFLFLCYYF